MSRFDSGADCSEGIMTAYTLVAIRVYRHSYILSWFCKIAANTQVSKLCTHTFVNSARPIESIGAERRLSGVFACKARFYKGKQRKLSGTLLPVLSFPPQRSNGKQRYPLLAFHIRSTAGSGVHESELAAGRQSRCGGSPVGEA